MLYSCAPLEGLTGRQFRKVHQSCFPGADRYYMPFLSPAQGHVFSQKELRELDPDYNRGIPVIPQLLTRRVEDFVWAAGELAAMGYREVNLNLGCPSGTVTAKGKGAGFLGRLEELERFLDEIFAHSPLPISIKTRLGVQEAEEFEAILQLYSAPPGPEGPVPPARSEPVVRVCSGTGQISPVRQRGPEYPGGRPGPDGDLSRAGGVDVWPGADGRPGADFQAKGRSSRQPGGPPEVS